ncbi:MAG: tetratricopeptide repeat protein, partial [Rhodospirillales bacterium]|nr:tetratricopeptide repeat protein [Rhodospirillales bacterium]
MKRLLSSCLLACTGVAAPVHAASEADWEALYGSALRQYAAGNYVQAEQEARRALALAREAGGRKEPFVASSLNALALAEQAQGRGEDAAGLLRQALALSEQALGAHPNTATLALNLGNALDALGRADAALVPYERALEIADARQDDGAMVPLRTQALSALARTHAGLGHANEARAYDRRLDT